MSRALRLGIFIVCTLAILVAGVFLIGEKQFLFASVYRLNANFKNVAGLNNGAEVRVGGIHKGTVKWIQLPVRPDGEVTVTMAMESATKKVIRVDSVASIQTEGLLGSKYVEISFGSDSAPSVNDGTTIKTVPPLDVSNLMEKANDILDSTKQTMFNVQAGTGNFRSISSKINQGEGTIGALINDKKVYEEIHQAADQAKLGATALQENMEALKHNFFLRGFFNQRGYEDLARLTENEITELPRGPMLQKFGYDAGKLFDKPDTAKLKNERTLNEAGQFLEKNPFGAAVVAASSGMKGDAEQERQLSQARAMVVRDYLVKNFRMDDTRLKTLGVGKNPQTGERGLVEILIYQNGVQTAAAKGAHP